MLNSVQEHRESNVKRTPRIGLTAAASGQSGMCGAGMRTVTVDWAQIVSSACSSQ